MPDGDGRLILVDLDAVLYYTGEIFDGSDNKYMLFTRYITNYYPLPKVPRIQTARH